MTEKPVKWLGDALERLKQFPDDGRRELGFQLSRVQNGMEPGNWKPMPLIGLGVKEIRVRGEEGAYRMIYLAKFVEAVYVLHTFQKKGQKTSREDIVLARGRSRDLMRERNRK